MKHSISNKSLTQNTSQCFGSKCFDTHLKTTDKQNHIFPRFFLCQYLLKTPCQFGEMLFFYMEQRLKPMLFSEDTENQSKHLTKSPNSSHHELLS